MFQVIPVKTTYLKMTSFEARQINSDIDENRDLFVYRLNSISINFYKFLYHEIGDLWGWSQRLMITDEELNSIINDSKTIIFVLYIEGKPSGFAEFYNFIDKKYELKYFGLLPNLTGKGYGKLFFNYTLNKIWELKPSEVKLQTCEYDSVGALSFYQKSGFEIFDFKICDENYPIEFVQKRQINK